MGITDTSSHHRPPHTYHHLNLHQHRYRQSPPFFSQPYSSSSARFRSPNPNHAVDAPFPSTSPAASDVLRPPGVDSYHCDPYASTVAFDGAESVALQSYADYYYHQQQQQYLWNSFPYGSSATRNVTADLESKRHKVIAGGASPGSVRVCSICNVVCNSDTVFAYHLAGGKHAFKTSGRSPNGLKSIPTNEKSVHLNKSVTPSAPKPAPPPAVKAKAFTALAHSLYCDVCKLECNSQDVLNNHKLGRKHIRNLQKLEEPAKPKPETPQPKQSKEDLEAKKQKVLSGGAAAAAVKVCTHCSVVCNSEAVYSLHTAGKKHIAMMNRLN